MSFATGAEAGDFIRFSPVDLYAISLVYAFPGLVAATLMFRWAFAGRPSWWVGLSVAWLAAVTPLAGLAANEALKWTGAGAGRNWPAWLVGAVLPPLLALPVVLLRWRRR